MFDKNVYKMTVVYCNYAVASTLNKKIFTVVASYLPCFHPETAGKCSIGKNTGGQRVTRA